MSVATMDSPMSPEPGSDKLRTALLVAAGVAVLALLAWGLSQIHLGTPSKPRQQVARIMLPDTPPPPPPKPEEKKPEPKQDNKPQPQQEMKQVQAPQPTQTLKTDEAASNNGAGPIGAGAVTNDIKPGQAFTPGTGSGSAAAEDRRRAQFYVNNIRRQLKEELERHLNTDADRMEVTFAIWVAADGRLSKYELQPTGNAQTDADARRAFDEAARSMRLDRPGDIVQPLRMKLTLSTAG